MSNNVKLLFTHPTLPPYTFAADSHIMNTMHPVTSRIYLASASPRRRELLKQINVSFETLLLRTRPERCDVDETPQPGEDPAAYVVRLAQAKAEAGEQARDMRRLPKHPVLAADTTVTFDGHILGKPENAHAAEAMLMSLSGRTHTVHTAIALSLDGRREYRLCSSTVSFKGLTTEEVRRYVHTGEPHDKAGAYAIQGRAAAFITNLNGSYSGVMGLPLFETAELLQLFQVPL